MSIEHVQQYQLDVIWPQVEGYIQSALDTGQGEMNASQARYAVALGKAELFFLHDDGKPTGAVLVEFINYSNYRVANVIAVGGKGVFRDWDEFTGWLKKGGASYVEGHCHDGMARLWKEKLNMKKVYTIMRGEI